MRGRGGPAGAAENTGSASAASSELLQGEEEGREKAMYCFTVAGASALAADASAPAIFAAAPASAPAASPLLPIAAAPLTAAGQCLGVCVRSGSLSAV